MAVASATLRTEALTVIAEIAVVAPRLPRLQEKFWLFAPDEVQFVGPRPPVNESMVNAEPRVPSRKRNDTAVPAVAKLMV